MPAEIRIPSLMKIGGGSFGEVAAVLLQLGCKRPLLVTDPFMVKAGLVERLEMQIRGAGLSCSTFSDTLPDPTSTVVEHGAVVFRAGGHDSLVSLGGGSPIDTAKAVGMLAAMAGPCVTTRLRMDRGWRDRCTWRFRRPPVRVPR